MNAVKPRLGLTSPMIILLLMMGFAVSAAFGQTAASPWPASGIFFDKGEAGLESVRNTAIAQSTSTPFYKSNGVETIFYEGYFAPYSNNSKLALLSDDGTSVWIDGAQVLNRAGTGQGFEKFETTFYPLSYSFQAGRTYHLRLQYTNTTHRNDADVDGISLWAYDGGGEMIDKSIALTTSSPDFIVYRNPADVEFEEPSIPDVSTPDEAEYPDSGDSFDDGDIDGGIGDGMDGPTNIDNVSDSEVEPALLIPPDNGGLNNPAIHFGVRVSGYQSWQATINVYPIADSNGTLGNAIASLTTTETSVTWNQLFPNQKPASGVYFYDIVLKGTFNPAQAPAREKLIGLNGSGKDGRRLDPELQVNELQYRLLEEDDQPLAAARRRSAHCILFADRRRAVGFATRNSRTRRTHRYRSEVPAFQAAGFGNHAVGDKPALAAGVLDTRASHWRRLVSRRMDSRH